MHVPVSSGISPHEYVLWSVSGKWLVCLLYVECAVDWTELKLGLCVEVERWAGTGQSAMGFTTGQVFSLLSDNHL